MKSEKGFSLVEVLIGLAILGIIGVGFLSALGTGLKVLTHTDVSQTAKNLAESQMEYVRSLPYGPSYLKAPIPAAYPGYDVDIDARPVTSRDPNIQKITITIEHSGEEILILEGYKVNG